MGVCSIRVFRSGFYKIASPIIPEFRAEFRKSAFYQRPLERALNGHMRCLYTYLVKPCSNLEVIIMSSGLYL